MHAIKVTGYIYIEDDEFDPGGLGPLTETAFLSWTGRLNLDDVEFTLGEES